MPVTVYGRSIEGLHLSRYGGLTIRIIPGTLHAWTEIEMAPEDGASPGNPDTAFAERIGLLEPGAASMPLRLPDGLWFFRARHFGEGKNTSGWTAWINGTAEDLPDDPYDTVLRTAGVEEPLTSGGGTFPHDINAAANHSNFPLDIDRGGTGVSAGVDDQFYYFDSATPLALQVLVIGTNEVILGTSPPTSGPITSAYTTGTFPAAAHAYGIHSDTIGSADVSGSYTGITGVGVLTAGTWNATTIAMARGGTDQTTVTTGDILFSFDGTGWNKLGIGSTDHVLTVSVGVPAWAAAVSFSGNVTDLNQSSPQGFIRSNTVGTAWEVETGGNTNDFMRLISAATNDVWEAVTLTQAMLSDLPITWANVSKTGSSLAELATRAISDTTGTLAINRGGTNLTSYADASALVVNAVNVISAATVTPDGNDKALTYNDGTGNIGWENFPAAAVHGLNSASHTGTLDVDNGGTGVASWAAQLNSILISGTTGTSSFQQITGGATTTYLRGQGADVAPVFATLDATVIAAGTFPTGLNIFRNSADEQLRLDHTSGTGSPALSFLQGGTGVSFIQHLDASNVFKIASEFGAVSLQPGVSGTEQERFYISNTDTSDAAGSPFRGVAKAVSAALFSEQYTHGTPGANFECFGRAGNKHHAILSANRTITITLEEDGQELTLYVHATGATRTIVWSGVDHWADTEDNTVESLTTNVYHFERINTDTVGYVISTDTLGVLVA